MSEGLCMRYSGATRRYEYSVSIFHFYDAVVGFIVYLFIPIISGVSSSLSLRLVSYTYSAYM